MTNAGTCSDSFGGYSERPSIIIIWSDLSHDRLNEVSAAWRRQFPCFAPETNTDQHANYLAN